MVTVSSEAESSEQSAVPDGILPSLTGNIEEAPAIPGLIFAIEEPELYQHPTKQRHFARVLSLLSDGALPGVVTKTQVIFASHSPYFVCMDRFDQVRLARRTVHRETGTKECMLREAHLSEVVNNLEFSRQVAAGTWTPESLKGKLHIVTPELSEGFFAEVVLLVEGESDKAALRAAAATRDIELEALGIALLQAAGKPNLDRPFAIFDALQIPTYVVWDCDRDRSGEIEDIASNRSLQRLLGVTEAEVVDAGDRIASTFACFEATLEVTLRREFGQVAYDNAIDEAVRHFGLPKRKDAIKASPVMKHAFNLLNAQGLRSRTLDGIIDRAVALKRVGAP